MDGFTQYADFRKIMIIAIQSYKGGPEGEQWKGWMLCEEVYMIAKKRGPEA